MAIEINRWLVIPDDALDEKFLAATGPGGQNVNKVATAVQLRCDTRLIPMPLSVRDRLRRIAGRRMTADGIILITAHRYRTQDMNRQDSKERLAEMFSEALVQEVARRATKPSRSSQRRRMDKKTARGDIKKARQRPALD